MRPQENNKKTKPVYFAPDVIECLEVILKEKDLPISASHAEYVSENTVKRIRKQIKACISRGGY